MREEIHCSEPPEGSSTSNEGGREKCASSTPPPTKKKTIKMSWTRDEQKRTTFFGSTVTGISIEECFLIVSTISIFTIIIVIIWLISMQICISRMESKLDETLSQQLKGKKKRSTETRKGTETGTRKKERPPQNEQIQLASLSIENEVTQKQRSPSSVGNISWPESQKPIVRGVHFTDV